MFAVYTKKFGWVTGLSPLSWSFDVSGARPWDIEHAALAEAMPVISKVLPWFSAGYVHIIRIR